MPTAKRSTLYEHLERRLRAGESYKREPALRPILVALHLLEGTSLFGTPEEAVLGRLRRAVHDYFISEVERFGWLRVPAPDETDLVAWIGSYISEAKLFGKRVLRDRDVPVLAGQFAALALQMWPVIGYFALDLMIANEVASRGLPARFLYELELEWTGPRGRQLPRLVRKGAKDRDVYSRLWQEAAVMLAVHKPSATVDKILRGKVKRVTDGEVEDGSSLVAAGRPLVETRLPSGTPFRAVAYVNTVLRNAGNAEAFRQNATHGIPRSTLQRYRKDGLSQSATAEEVGRFAAEKARSQRHHAEGHRTKRQLAKDLENALKQKVSLRTVQSAIDEVQAELGRPPRKEKGALRLDRNWCTRIKAVVARAGKTKAAKMSAKKLT